VDNEAKACLDDVALNLQRDADSKAVLVGNSASSERHGEKAAAERAVNTKAYLVNEKGIDPSRIDVRTGTAGTESVQNYLVPSGDRGRYIHGEGLPQSLRARENDLHNASPPFQVESVNDWRMVLYTKGRPDIPVGPFFCEETNTCLPASIGWRIVRLGSSQVFPCT
jgi:hypothetical protein